MAVTPKQFKPRGGDRMYELIPHQDAELTSIAINVHMEGEELVYEFPSGHGSSFRMKRIERETEDEITFTTENPPVDLFEGAVTFRDMGTDYVW